MIDKVNSNNVNFAYMKSQFASDNIYDVYFLLFLSDSSSASYDNSGFIVTFQEDITVTVTQNGVTVDGNADDYVVLAEMSVDSSDGAVCEMRIGAKKGLPQNVAGTISFIDGEGNKSYYYPFELGNPNIEEETTTHKADNIAVKNTTKAEKEKTTKSVTKKVTTTKQKTTKPKTTKTTTAKSQQKTTKSKDSKTVVYFYEKEIIVSEVYVSDAVQTDFNTETSSGEESTTVPAVTSFLENSPPSKGLKIQKAICITGFGLLIILGAVAGISESKKKNSLKSADSSVDSDDTDNSESTDNSET